MAMPTLDLQKINFGFTDGLQNHSVVSHYVPLGTAAADTTITDLYDALDAVSNAAMENWTFTYAGTDPTAAGANTGAYPTVENGMQLAFQASDNSTVLVTVPSPIDACFTTDKKTVDKAQAAVATLIVKILAIIVTKGGAILLEYLWGKRVERKPRKTKAGVTLQVP